MTINITWHFYCLVTNSQLAHVVHHKWLRQAVCTPATGRELTHTLNLTFLYVTVSTLKPTVGMVVTDWPSFNLYRMAEMESRALILETHTHTDTRTHWHTDTRTHWHTHTLTHAHTDTCTHWHKHTLTHSPPHPHPTTPLPTTGRYWSSLRRPAPTWGCACPSSQRVFWTWLPSFSLTLEMAREGRGKESE